jgi:hypothetical protein
MRADSSSDSDKCSFGAASSKMAMRSALKSKRMKMKKSAAPE